MKKILKLLVPFVVVGISCLVFAIHFSLAATQTGSITVGGSIPCEGTSCGGGGTGGGGSSSKPVITVTGTSTAATSAQVAWQVAADQTSKLTVASTTFQYGISSNLGTYVVPSGQIGDATDNFSVNISGLTTGTLYYYSIWAEDSGGATNKASGQFITNVPPPAPTIAISNVSVSVSTTTSTVSWSTNVNADGQILYGISANYGSSTALPSPDVYAMSHSITLENLNPSTTYHYQIISTDQSGNATSTADATFTTLPVIMPPPDITFSPIATTTDSIVLSWTNPTSPDFNGVTIVRKIGSASTSTTDGVVIYTGTGTNFTDTSVSSSVNYYYTAFSFNSSLVYSPGTFVSGEVVTPPPSFFISNISVATSTYDATISWTTSVPATSKIDYGITAAYGSSASDSTLVSTHSLTLNNLSAATTYHFKISGINSDGTSASSSDKFFTTAPPPKTTLAIENITVSVGQNSAQVSWQTNINASGQIEYGLTTAYGQSASDSTVSGSHSLTLRGLSPGTVYHYRISAQDNNGDQAATSDQTLQTTAPVSPPPSNLPPGSGGSTPGCNGDCSNPACASLPLCTYVPPTSTVSSSAQLTLNNFIFLAGNRQIELQPVNGTVTSLASSGFSIKIPASVLFDTPQNLIVKIDGDGNQHNFVYASSTASYFSDFIFPSPGAHRAFIEIDYGNGLSDSVIVPLRSLPFGQVTDGSNPLDQASVTLLSATGQAVLTRSYGFNNPLTTDVSGAFGWVVPNGTYSILASKKGYFDHQPPSFTIDNNVVNISVSLVQAPTSSNVISQTTAVVKLGLQKISDTVTQVQQFKENKTVQATTANVVAPTIVGVTAVGVVALSWANLWPFFQLLFFEPLLLLGRRRREGWGQIYNSLSKLPIDLATVRLVNADTGRLIQSKVTDRKGRYAFIASPGRYYIEVNKENFAFPSGLLKTSKDDGRRTDIYHGEAIAVSEKDAVITANIPLDPVGEIKKPVRIFWQHLARRVQLGLSWTGIIITSVACYISPRWYVFVLLGVHAIFFLIFRRLAIPPKIKSWGIVYDAVSRKPLARTIARLFNSQFNKLVSTQITDNHGRYYFLAGDNQYYVTYEHPNYAEGKSALIDLNGKEAENIALDVALKKSGIQSSSEQKMMTSSPAQDTPPVKTIVSSEKKNEKV